MRGETEVRVTWILSLMQFQFYKLRGSKEESIPCLVSEHQINVKNSWSISGDTTLSFLFPPLFLLHLSIYNSILLFFLLRASNNHLLINNQHQILYVCINHSQYLILKMIQRCVKPLAKRKAYIIASSVNTFRSFYHTHMYRTEKSECDIERFWY